MRSAWSVAAAMALAMPALAWNVEMPPCLDKFKPFVKSGCFANGEQSAALVYRSSLDQGSMTVEKCVAECKGNGFRYAGLKYYGVCFCGATVNGPQVDDAKCSFACSGNKTETCGGDSTLSIWQDPTFAKGPNDVSIDAYKALGCFTDQSAKGRTLSWAAAVDAATLTTSKCLAACEKQGFPFAGTEYGGECWCGVVLANDTAKVGDEECGVACRGDARASCGGASRLSLYVARELESLEPCGFEATTTTAKGAYPYPTRGTLLPSSASLPISQSSSASYPASQSTLPSSASLPVSQPSSASYPVHQPSSASLPVSQPSSASLPVSQPSSVSYPVHQPSSASLPISQPSSTSYPVHQPSSASLPVSQSPPASLPISQSPSISISVPLASSSSPSSSAAANTPSSYNSSPASTASSSKPAAASSSSTNKATPTTLQSSLVAPTTPPTSASPSTTPHGSLSSSAALCTSTTTVPAPCEWQIGNWCAPALPDWTNQDECIVAAKTCALQVVSCFRHAGWPSSIDCFDFGRWCGNLQQHCYGSDCSGGYGGRCSGKKTCWDRYAPPGHGNPPAVSTSVHPCASSASSTRAAATPTLPPSCPPLPTNICTQPSNDALGYGPGNPVGNIPLPIVGCNDLRDDYNSYPFKYYSEPDSSRCPSFAWRQWPDVCVDACTEQFDQCRDTYVQSCRRPATKRSVSRRAARQAEGVSRRGAVSLWSGVSSLYGGGVCAATADDYAWSNPGADAANCWGWGGNTPAQADKRCRSQYTDCLRINKRVDAEGMCQSYCSN